MSEIEKLNSQIEVLKIKQSELNTQLEKARQDNANEKALSGQALLAGKTVDQAAAGMVKSADRITVLENAGAQIKDKIKATEVKLSAAVFEVDKAAMDDLGNAASIEADRVADQLMAAIKGLVKIDVLFMQSLGLESRNYGKLGRAPAFQVKPGRIINRTLGILGQVSFCTKNKKALDGLNKFESELRLVRE